MKTKIIYYSKTGMTAKYAKWLAEEMCCQAETWGKAKKDGLSDCDTVVFASCFHAGKIKKIDWFLNLPLEGRDKVVVATGATPAGSKMAEEGMRANIPDGCGCRAFYLQSGLCYEKMGGADRLMMKVFAKMMNGKKDKSAEEEEMCRALGKSFDFCSREQLKPVIKYLEELKRQR